MLLELSIKALLSILGMGILMDLYQKMESFLASVRTRQVHSTEAKGTSLSSTCGSILSIINQYAIFMSKAQTKLKFIR